MNLNGVININKPKGMTSHDVVAKIRRRLCIKKVGHTGTLDPMATGVLPVCVGNATRMIEYYDNDFKTYHASMQLGIQTDTLDITGEVLNKESFKSITKDSIEGAFGKYIGQVSQTPPRYSALKINGKKAYELAREGKEFTLKAREIFIKQIGITYLDISKGIIEFDVECSKGTYIRTICDDIGKDLGCGGCMTDLVRTSNGCFDISESVSLQDLVEADDEAICAMIRPIDETLVTLGIVELKELRLKYFMNGNGSYNDGYSIIVNKENYYRVYCNDVFLGVASIDENGVLVPEKVFK